ncbi:MAG TPA: MarR family winged helix-turn-helix transcriptional regulator [Solirubrobacteraceae bacterium]|jgi:DNA-binding MarR family transcriptional regulator|nr:MarR family winged helix-turn-helix transcriptional regulator [Solirubrobacteraceae bacterium]
MHTTATNALSAWVVIASDLAESATAEASGLPERALAALVFVSNRPACGIDWLYRRLGVTQSGAVRLVDRLEDHGLLIRERTAGRREVALRLTAAGEACLSHGLRARAASLETLVAPLSPDEQTQLVKLIAKSLAHGRRRRDQADVACRLCEWDACTPDCPVDESVVPD